MWSGAGALPMSCPLLEGYSLQNLEMLDVAEKDPVAPASAPAPLLQILKMKNRLCRYLRSPVLQSQWRMLIQREG